MRKNQISSADILAATAFIPNSKDIRINALRQIIKMIFRYIGKVMAIFFL